MADEIQQNGVWCGLPVFQCPRCAFERAGDKAAVADHFRREHGQAVANEAIAAAEAEEAAKVTPASAAAVTHDEHVPDATVAPAIES